MQIVISGDERADVDQILRSRRLSGARAGHNAILALATQVGTDREIEISKIISAVGTSRNSWPGSWHWGERTGEPAEVPVTLEVHSGVLEPQPAQARAEGDHGATFPE